MSAVPSNFIPVEQESIQFNNPVSEASLSAIAGLANGLLSIALPIGSVVSSTLTEVQFQSQLGNPSPATWVLADGRDITGSDLNLLTGQTEAFDLRGIFVRGKNNGRSDGDQNPDGDLAIGTYTADKLASHLHQIRQGQTGFLGGGSFLPTTNPAGFQNSELTGENETAPKNVTLNYFIRIN